MSSPAWRIRRRNLTGRVRPRRGEPRVVFEVWMDPFPGGPYADRLWRVPPGTAEQVRDSLAEDMRRMVRWYLAAERLAVTVTRPEAALRLVGATI